MIQSAGHSVFQWYEDWFTTNLIYARWAQRRGLTDTTLFILWVIEKYPDSCTLRLICEKLSLPKQTAASALNGLERRGYLRRIPHPRDKRNKLIRFTPEGREYAEPLLRPMEEAENRAFLRMEPSVREKMIEGYHQLTVLLEEELNRE